MSDEDLYRRAEARVDEKIGFYRHLKSFLIVNVILLLVNAVSSPGYWWFYWITLFWGIGLVGHFLKTFVFVDRFDEKRDEMIENEMRKMKK